MAPWALLGKAGWWDGKREGGDCERRRSENRMRRFYCGHETTWDLGKGICLGKLLFHLFSFSSP